MVNAEAPSPWWYRQRGFLIGIAYGVGFTLGYLSFDDTPRQPAFVVWGDALGPHGATVLAWLGVALAIMAWAIRAAGTAYLRREVVFAADTQRDRLVVAGPFRYVRNPLYLGNIVLAIGVALFAPPLGAAFIVLGNVAIVIALAREEVRVLRARYGAAFDAYAAAVPAFVPRFTPAAVPGSQTVEPSLASGFLGEIGVMLAALSLAPVAAFGRAGLPALDAILVLAVIASFVAVRRRNSPGSAPRT